MMHLPTLTKLYQPPPWLYTLHLFDSLGLPPTVLQNSVVPHWRTGIALQGFALLKSPILALDIPMDEVF